MTSFAHLLLCGWYRPGTGFTRVLQALLPYFLREYHITWVGVGYRGAPTDLAPGVRLLPTNLTGGDLMGAYALRLNWDKLAADVILVLNDLWFLKHYSRELATVKGGVPMFGYLPLDGRLEHAALVDELEGYHTLVTYTESAARDLRAALTRQRSSIGVAVVGHGVDQGCFRPLLPIDQPDLMSARMRMAKAFFGLDQPSFVVLNASRPDPRKRIDLTLAAFARFAQGRGDEVRLCLHHAIAHPPFVDALKQQVLALGLQDRVIFWPPAPGPVDDEDLNHLYNACALGVNTALGEGFGLVSFEHAAVGVPQVVPDHAAMAELWGDAAMRVPTRPCYTDHSPLRMGEVDVAAVARAFADLCDDPIRYSHAARVARLHASSPAFDWRMIGKRLCRLLRDSRGI